MENRFAPIAYHWCFSTKPKGYEIDILLYMRRDGFFYMISRNFLKPETMSRGLFEFPPCELA